MSAFFTIEKSPTAPSYVPTRLYIADGYLRSGRFTALLQGTDHDRFMQSSLPLDAPITGLHRAFNHVSGETCIVGSAEDGTVGVWELE